MILQRSYKMSIITLGKGEIGHWLPEGPDVEGQINLDKLSDVTIATPTDSQSLQYNAATSQWINAAITATSIDGGTY